MKNKHKKVLESLYIMRRVYIYMKNLKIKAPNTILHDKELKLYDFIEDFVEIESKAFLKIDKSKCNSKSVTRT